MNSLVRLTDIQLVLLATAAQRENGSLLPPPDTLGDGPARIRKVVEQLIRRGLAEEVALPSGADAWRTEGKRLIGVVITDAGRAAIAVEPEEPETPAPELTSPEMTTDASAAADAEEHEDPAPTPSTGNEAATGDNPTEPPNAAPQLPAAHTKSALVLDMLRRDRGATLDELTSATNWLPHTTRAALTGLRKKGHTIDKHKRGEVSCYHLGSQA
ncbi:DUF3489 domain-containing protein [Sphingobium bisphenolivorans]|uniref:DUF3489 domain-containing protein n=1 Tax=Sphingobium bisphenolivorans TaxID=1335760 RepID=UPI0003A26270|nr:DUF3489 domain-containing protein [Sphingobium bisphenolivorans]